jgi:hypothetical protein
MTGLASAAGTPNGGCPGGVLSGSAPHRSSCSPCCPLVRDRPVDAGECVAQQCPAIEIQKLTRSYQEDVL